MIRLASLWLSFTVLFALLCAGSPSPAAPTAAASAAPLAAPLMLGAPAGGAPLALPEGLVVCEAGSDWTATADGKLQPPKDAATPVGRRVELAAAAAGQCTQPSARRRVVAAVVAPLPELEDGTLRLDEGRLTLIGKRLRGLFVGGTAGTEPVEDRCDSPTEERGKERCELTTSPRIAARPELLELRWSPAGLAPGASLFDGSGRLVPDSARRVSVARVLVSRLLAAEQVVDLSNGDGVVPLLRPEAVVSASCDGARCELDGGALRIRGLEQAATEVAVTLRLRPRVFIAKGAVFESEQRLTLPVTFCPLQLLSGPVLRDVLSPRVVVKLGGRCAEQADGLRWSVGEERADALAQKRLDDGVVVLLRAKRVLRDELSIVARRGDALVVALTRAATRTAPRPSAVVELAGYGPIDFVPNNRSAQLRVSAIGGGGTLVPIAQPGAYRVVVGRGGTSVRAETGAFGFATLRFAYRWPELESLFPALDLAVLEEPTQRRIGEANVPAALGAGNGKPPIVELVCADATGKARPIPVGAVVRVPFEARKSCRLLLHQARLEADVGEQRLKLDVEVRGVGNVQRADGRLSEELVVRHQRQTRAFWLRGVTDHYDRALVRVSHVVDEGQYLGARSSRFESTAAQWEVVFESASFRFYATAAIPTSLFRFSNDPQSLGTGPLALNFGVLSRLTWLDREGRDGLMGLDLGVMGMGISSDTQRQLNLVSGVSVGIPLGNIGQPTQAALNVHAWVAYRLGEQTGILRDSLGQPTGTIPLSAWSFIFGPSITIGSVGTTF